eukprot:435623_1
MSQPKSRSFMSQSTNVQYRVREKLRRMKPKQPRNSRRQYDSGFCSQPLSQSYRFSSNPIDSRSVFTDNAINEPEQQTANRNNPSLNAMKQRIRAMRGFGSQKKIESDINNENHAIQSQNAIAFNQLLEALEHFKREQQVQTDKIISKLDSLQHEIQTNKQEMKQNQIANNDNSYSQIERIQDIHKLIDSKLNKYNKKLVNDINDNLQSLKSAMNHELMQSNKQTIKHMDRKWKEMHKNTRNNHNKSRIHSKQKQRTRRRSVVSDTLENSQVFDILFDSKHEEPLPAKHRTKRRLKTYKRKRRIKHRKQCKEIHLFDSSSEESSDEEEEEDEYSDDCGYMVISNRPRYKRRRLVNSMTSQYV